MNRCSPRAKGVTDSYRGFLGSGPVADRLDAAMTNWSQQRGKVVENLDGLGQTAQAAAQAYQETDLAIVRAASGRTAPDG